MFLKWSSIIRKCLGSVLIAVVSCNLLDPQQSQTNEKTPPDACQTDSKSPSLALIASQDPQKAEAASIGALIINTIGDSLVNAGLSQAAAMAIKNDASSEMQIVISSLVIDPNADPIESNVFLSLAGPIIRGAMEGVGGSCANLSDNSQRSMAVSAIVGGTTKSLGAGNTKLPEAGIPRVIYQATLAAGESLDKAGLSGVGARQGIAAITDGAMRGIDDSGISPANVAAAAKSVASGTVASLGSIGIESSEVGAFASLVVGSVIDGLTNSGMSPQDVIDSGALGQIVSGAAGALSRAGITSAQATGAMGSIASTAINSFEDAGIVSLEMKRSALAGVMGGMLEGVNEGSNGDGSQIALAMAEVSSQAVSALDAGGFSSGEILAAITMIVEVSVAKLANIGIQDATIASSITVKIIEGARSGAEELEISGKIDASQLAQSDQAIFSGASNGLDSLKTAGVVKSASDVAAFNSNIESASRPSATTTSTLASTPVVTTTTEVADGIPTVPALVNFSNGQTPTYTIGGVETNPAGGTLSNNYGSPIVIGTKLIIADPHHGSRFVGWNTIPTTDVAADFVLGGPTFDPTAPALSASSMGGPHMMGVASNKLIVAEWGANRVLFWSSIPPLQMGGFTTQPASYVFGASDFETAGAGGCDSTHVVNPECMGTTPSGKVLVADRGNNRILIWNSVPTANNQVPNIFLGQTDSTQCDAVDHVAFPMGVWSNDTQLFVANYFQNKVQVWNTFPTSNRQTPSFELTGMTTPYYIHSNGRQLVISHSGGVAIWNSLPTADVPPDVTLDAGSSPAGVFLGIDRLFVSTPSQSRVAVFVGNL